MKKMIQFLAIICYIWLVLWIFDVPLALDVDVLFILCLVPGTAFAYYLYRSFNNELCIKTSILKELLMYIPFYLIGSFFEDIITTEISQNQAELVKEAIEMSTSEILFTFVIFGPFIEEIFFRYIPNIFIKNDWVYILLASTIFATAHVTNDPHAFRNFWVYFITPVYWTYRHRRTNNIFVPLSMHMFGNLIASLILLYNIRS